MLILKGRWSRQKEQKVQVAWGRVYLVCFRNSKEAWAAERWETAGHEDSHHWIGEGAIVWGFSCVVNKTDFTESEYGGKSEEGLRRGGVWSDCAEKSEGAGQGQKGRYLGSHCNSPGETRGWLGAWGLRVALRVWCRNAGGATALLMAQM